ncbi:deoxyribonuclease II family protein, partial [Salmonella sp. s54836]|uniref:deoxyribonuclease II family protein n=1 Tax=Salmonella sp. s54836 TaxID=3159673 RepID=UPI003981526D
RTLSQIYNVNYSTVGYAKYNDEEPDNTTDSTDAHCKGTIGFDADSGFWLLHNVPRYPPYSKSMVYSYPESGTYFGQNMLCMSYSITSIDIVGYQLRMNGPHFY